MLVTLALVAIAVYFLWGRKAAKKTVFWGVVIAVVLFAAIAYFLYSGGGPSGLGDNGYGTDRSGA